MLGQRVSDPQGLEGGGRCKGLGLLPHETLLERNKELTQVEGHFSDDLPGFWSCLRGRPLNGYEIHMGKTNLVDFPPKDRRKGREDWVCLDQVQSTSLQGSIHGSTEKDDLMKDDLRTEGMILGSVLGTYVHGIFDRTGNAEALLNAIAEKKGLSQRYEPREAADFAGKQYDLLADCLQDHMDMRQIEKILNL